MSKSSPLNPKLNTVEEIIADISQGKMVIIVDDENRENEGDIVMAAEMITPEKINFMANYARGLICTPMEPAHAQRLALNPMVEDNSSSHSTAFTVSIDAMEGITTGISSADRSHTIKLMTEKTSRPGDFARPGHIFPLIAKAGGVTERPGHTEAAVDLSKLAGMQGIGVICEIIKDDGTMARLDDLKVFAKKHDLKVGSIEDLIDYQNQKRNFVVKKETIDFPTKFGEFQLTLFIDEKNSQEHLCVYKEKTLEQDAAPLVRIHSKCVTGDIFGSRRCDCGEQLAHALQEIEKKGSGFLVYMDQEGRGIGLANKIRAYKLQQEGMDTVEANEHMGFDSDLRNYKVAAEILKQMGLTEIKLLSNNPKKLSGLLDNGIRIKTQVPIEMTANKDNFRYLQTKKTKLGHQLNQFFQQ